MAAEAWAAAYTGQTDRRTPARIDDDMSRQFQALGLSVASAGEATIDILPPNHASVTAWIECQTQWRRTGFFTGVIFGGLDYAAVRAVLEDLDSPPGVFADIRRMERAALPILNDRD